MASEGLRSNQTHAWAFHAGDLASADVQALLKCHFAEMQATSPPEAYHVLPSDGLADPAITLWSLREAGTLLGVAALKELSPGHGEVKSMRRAPAALGRGVGRAMLHHIIGEARRRGYGRLSLETGGSMPFAAPIGLYVSEGFMHSRPFGGYPRTPFTRFFTLNL